MLFLGVMVTIQGIEGASQRGLEERVRAFSIVPITIILFFAATFAAAIANVRRPEVHMRLLVVAACWLLSPALGGVGCLGIAAAGVGVNPARLAAIRRDSSSSASVRCWRGR